MLMHRESVRSAGILQVKKAGIDGRGTAPYSCRHAITTSQPLLAQIQNVVVASSFAFDGLGCGHSRGIKSNISFTKRQNLIR
jgi:hypothetical protein